ncbi:GGDEF domain-containing protein [Paenibacillus larvae]
MKFNGDTYLMVAVILMLYMFFLLSNRMTKMKRKNNAYKLFNRLVGLNAFLHFLIVVFVPMTNSEDKFVMALFVVCKVLYLLLICNFTVFFVLQAKWKYISILIIASFLIFTPLIVFDNLVVHIALIALSVYILIITVLPTMDYCKPLIYSVLVFVICEILSIINPNLNISFFFTFLYFSVFFLVYILHVIDLLEGSVLTSVIDNQTSLYNRRHFIKCVQRSIEEQFCKAIIFLDIDNFKELNDSKGHQVGDQVLHQVAKILKEETEEIGIAGRYGGEEMDQVQICV